MYKIYYSKVSLKQIELLKSARLDKKVKNLIDLISLNPFQNPPPYEKLIGDMSGLYSRRINIQHRLVYEVFEQDKNIKIVSMWSHYEY